MKAYLKSRAKVITAFLLFESIFAAVLLLSGVPLGAFGYASALCGAAAVCYGVCDFVHFRRKCRILEQLKEEIEITCENLPKPEGAVEAGYAELVRQLHRSRIATTVRPPARQRAMPNTPRHAPRQMPNSPWPTPTPARR